MVNNVGSTKVRSSLQKFLTTVKTANFRQKKGLNPGVELQLVSQRWTCVELLNVTLSTVAIICSTVPIFLVVFYVPIDSTKSQLSNLIACIKAINLTIFPRKFIPFILSHIL